MREPRPSNGVHLVTGTAGFIGFHLAQRLLREGRQVIGLDSVNDYYDVSLKEARLAELAREFPDFVSHRLHLEDRDGMERLFAQSSPTVVINLAAQAGVRYSLENPRAYIDSNVVGFTNLLECCRHQRVEHLVYASSSSVYGLNSTVPFAVGDTVDHPINLYAATKKSNELMAHTYSHLFGIPTTGLRFFTVYGPWGRPDMALFLFTKAILAGEPIKVFNKGNMQRDFTYIDDIVEGVIGVTDRPAEPDPTWSSAAPDPASSSAPYRVQNIGNNNPVQLLRMIKVLEEALGRKAEKLLMPIQPGDVQATFANIDPLIADVGFKPDTSIEHGVGQFVEWYRGFYGA
jgi:UDP-glucuronate 4-epimerase